MISIIVPVYNSQEYIEECIESILAQTYPDWELMLIDDGSSDASSKICDTYADRDTRIKVVHKTNGGASSARNLGISLAQGEWITFVDDDDFIYPDYLADMIAEAAGHECDLIASGYNMKTDKSPEYAILDLPDHIQFINSKVNLGLVCAKLFKTEVIRKYGLKFNQKVRWAEDAIFTYNFATYCDNRIITIPATNYYYRYRENSAAKKTYPLHNEVEGFKCAVNLTDRLVNRYTTEALKRFTPFPFLTRVVSALYASGNSRRERIDLLRSLDFNPKLMPYPSGTLKERIAAYLLINRHWYILDLLLSK